MVKQPEMKQSPSTIRPKLEQIQRRISPRKRPAPKLEEVEEVVVDDIIEPVINVKQNENVISANSEQQQEEEIIEFTRGFTNKGALCIWHNGIFIFKLLFKI
jgi:hypothetical protein